MGALGSRRGLAGPTNSPFGGNSQRSSTFLCALFFVLLKFSPSCRWSPPPPQPQKGAEAWGVIRNPDCAKLHCGRPSCNGAPHCLPGLDEESFLWSRCTPNSLDWSQGLQSSRTMAKNGHRGRLMGVVGAGQIARGDNKERKSIVFPFYSPRRERKLPKPRLQYLIGKQGIWFELAEGTPPPPRSPHLPRRVSRTTQAPAGYSPREPAQPRPSNSRSRLPSRSPNRAWSQAAAQPTGKPVGEATQAGGNFVSSARGAPRSGRSQRLPIAAPPPQAGD